MNLNVCAVRVCLRSIGLLWRTHTNLHATAFRRMFDDSFELLFGNFWLGLANISSHKHVYTLCNKITSKHTAATKTRGRDLISRISGTTTRCTVSSYEQNLNTIMLRARTGTSNMYVCVCASVRASELIISIFLYTYTKSNKILYVPIMFGIFLRFSHPLCLRFRVGLMRANHSNQVSKRFSYIHLS